MLKYFACILMLFLLLPSYQARTEDESIEKVTVLRAGRVFDARGGRMLENQVVVIRGERIERVGPEEELTVPEGATFIDLGESTLLPGLIDCHVHLTSNPENSGLHGLEISVPRSALTGARNAARTLQAGFTTVRNVGAPGYSDVALRDSIDAKELPGPRIIPSGPAIGSTGGHCDETYLAPEFRYTEPSVADGVPEVLAKTREVMKYGAGLIKFCASGGVFSKGDQPGTTQYSEEEMAALVAEAHRQGRRVAAHAHGAQAVVMAARAGADSIEHGSLIDDDGIRVMKEHGTFLVGDIYNDDFILSQGKARGFTEEMLAKEREIGQRQREGFRSAAQAGVRIAYGTDAGVYPHGWNARQFPFMVRYGLTPVEALQSATIWASELIGWQDRVGTIEPGKWADMIAVEGDPRMDISILERVNFVMKGGEIFRNNLAR